MNFPTIVSRYKRSGRNRNVLDCTILFVFWLLFYVPIWTGARHVGWDMDGFNYPLDRFLLDGLSASHHLPTWDWFEYNGIDFSGDIQTGAFYPPKLLLLLLLAIMRIPLTYPLYQLFALSHVLVFSLSTYYVARMLKLPRFYCIAAAICLAYTGVLQAQIEHFWFVGILPWIPLAAYFGFRATQVPSAMAFYLYVLFSTCMFLVGYPPQYLTIQVDIVLFVALMQLFRGADGRLFRSAKAIMIMVAGQVFTCLLSGAMLFPFAALARGSIADAYGRTYPIQSLLTALLPDAFGHLSGKLTFETDPTTSYMYLGLFFEVALLTIPLAYRSMRGQLSSFVVPSILLVANLLLMVSSFSDFMHDHAPWIAFLRPQSGAMPFAVAFTALAIAIIMYADRSVHGKFRLLVRAATIAAVMSLFVNHPGYFNTPTEPASVIEPDSEALVTSGIPDRNYSLAIDQSTIGGPGDDWPRVFHIRSLGGEDPLAQKSYLETLDIRGLHNSGRRVFFTTDADLKWLEENGVGFVMTGDPRFGDLARKSGFTMVQPAPFSIYRLPHALPLATASCATITSTNFGWDELFVSYEARAACPLRLTTNYSPFFSADNQSKISPVTNGLGMIVASIQPGKNVLRIAYSNPFAIAGNLITLLATIVLLLLALREYLRTRRLAIRHAG